MPSFFHLHNIRRIRKYLSRDSTEKLIHAFVSIRLDYCNGLLYMDLISILQRVQNTAARIVYCMPTFCHITPRLFDLHWLPLKFRIYYKIIITTFKCLHNTVPHYLSSLLSVQMNSKYGLISTNQLLLSRPNFKTLATIGDRAFIAAAPKLWNTQPLTIRQIDNFNLFKNKLLDKLLMILNDYIRFYYFYISSYSSSIFASTTILYFIHIYIFY